MKKIIFVLILLSSIMIMQITNFAIVKSKGKANVSTYSNTGEPMPRKEVISYFKTIKKLLDGLDDELLQKVASRSETHGYVVKK